MGAAREPDQADFDLERFIDMFDEAMTSKDPRVIETLRSLLMIVTLTRPEARPGHDRNSGPLRRLFEDLHDLNRRVTRHADELQNLTNKLTRSDQPYRWEYEDKYTMTAAQGMAQSIDRDLMRELSKSTALQINGGKWPKGKL
jgi:hypothetical protein